MEVSTVRVDLLKLVKNLLLLSRNTETRFGEENERLALERDTIVFGWT